ncbi:hypothetical protein K7X08_028614 [Anisodus acutangulus]|uniref:Uncharacterized protein n=1 Tax=Anisodus acutangulus TaxID=402998 RepID=A0A9Q1LWS5_9SOLA|nr:hypothetical protein K7X08_028614 [Anisodus acutangulus]
MLVGRIDLFLRKVKDGRSKRLKGKIKGCPVWGNPNSVDAFLNENSPPTAACPSIMNSKALGLPVSKF